MSGSYFADVNVLLALSVANHHLGSAAHRWASETKPRELLMCRVAQLAFLRLITTASVMGENTLSNVEAWSFHDRLIAAGLVRFVQEPVLPLDAFRERSLLPGAAPKRWNDAYMSAFASSAKLQLVTFDATLASYTPGSILLRA